MKGVADKSLICVIFMPLYDFITQEMWRIRVQLNQNLSFTTLIFRLILHFGRRLPQTPSSIFITLLLTDMYFKDGVSIACCVCG